MDKLRRRFSSQVDIDTPPSAHADAGAAGADGRARGSTTTLRRSRLFSNADFPPDAAQRDDAQATDKPEQFTLNQKLNFGDEIYLTLTDPNDAQNADGSVPAFGESAPSHVSAQGAFQLSEGFSDLRVGMQCGTTNPKNFRYALFRVCQPLSYEASKSVKKLERRDSVTEEDMLERLEEQQSEENKNRDIISGLMRGGSGSAAYDPRFRDWYSGTASGPKDVVLVIDTL